jgi:tRNA(adenine34) deaminase
MHDDDYFMQRCSALAEKAAANGNSAIGSLIVKDDQVISEGKEAVSSKKDITCHAEIEALRLAVKHFGTTDLSGCILYSTHEPCIMCSYAIRYYKITKVIYRDEANCLGGISSVMPLLITNEVPPHWSKAPVIVHLKKEK